jgi:poly(3-hydroxybutyrate) depolymerase
LLLAFSLSCGDGAPEPQRDAEGGLVSLGDAATGDASTAPAALDASPGVDGNGQAREAGAIDAARDPADAATRDATASDASAGEPSDAGDASPAVPSAGCGKGARPANGVVTVTGDHIYNFPASYDGKKPLPLVVALHANGNPYTQLQSLSNGTRLESNFVRAFPKSAGAGWVLNTDAARITAVYDDLMANYCIDKSRVFLTGHSSGAQMAVQMLCVAGGEKRFKAVAPVAASKYCQKIAPIAVMYIQGMKDAMRGNGNGMDVVNFFTSSNGCSSASTPDDAVAGCNSSFDHMAVKPGCVGYQGCTQPTVWCSHNDNGYNASDGNQHGWPCFASNAMADFFLGLP